MAASFQAQLESGLLEIIAPPAEFYPNMTDIRQTMVGRQTSGKAEADTVDRIRWRTKQNLDYAYLMMYARQRSLYYVQLEDDIVTKKDFVKTMKEPVCFLPSP